MYGAAETSCTALFLCMCKDAVSRSLPEKVLLHSADGRFWRIGVDYVAVHCRLVQSHQWSSQFLLLQCILHHCLSWASSEAELFDLFSAFR